MKPELKKKIEQLEDQILGLEKKMTRAAKTYKVSNYQIMKAERDKLCYKILDLRERMNTPVAVMEERHIPVTK